MADPRQSLNPTTHSVGFTARLVTVRSVSADGKSATCVDRQNTQVTVPMLVQRSKGPLPAPGETWLLTQDLGTWLFAAIVATSEGQFISGSSDSGGTRTTVSATPPASPATGDIWVNGASGNAVFWWSGTNWISAQFGTQAIADKAITRAKIAGGAITTAELDPAAGITASQVAFSVTEIGGVRIFTGTSQPPNPAQGDLWINPDQGNALYFWDNGKWTGLLLGAGAIAPGSLTSFQISPSAGIANGQVDFTARDIGGITTSVTSVQPANPATGDLWFDGNASYALKQWDGTSWNLFQFGTNAISAGSVTAALIAANTITAAQIAAGTITATQIAAGTITASKLVTGIVVAGIVDATTITGAQFVATGTAGEILVYSGTPALGNLVASVNAQPGFVDSFGNVVGNGIFSYSSPSVLAAVQGGSLLIQNGSFPWVISVDNATQSVFVELPHTGQGLSISVTGLAPLTGTLGLTSPEVTDSLLLDAVGAPAAPGSGVKIFGSSSGLLSIRGTDGNVYLAGRRTVSLTGPQTVSSATFTTVTDGTNTFAASVVAASYKFRARIIYKPSGTTGNPTFGITSPTFSSGGASMTLTYNGITSGFGRYDNTSPFASVFASALNSTVTTALFVIVDIEGQAVFSASGTLAIKAEIGSPGSNIVIQQGSFFELEPL